LKRPAKEVAFLMNFNEKLLLARLEELHEHDVRIRFIEGEKSGFLQGYLSECKNLKMNKKE
jgi:undecaprenyl pyrophosphate synthase